MPSTTTANAGAPADDLDNLFNYDDTAADFLTTLPYPKPAQPTTHPTDTKDVDEEVIVRKKRAPVPKLDANLLLSPAGLPKLRKIAKTRLKFRGKGHEFADMAMLLGAYQLWLDDLYPRAKFRDALGMVEKAGHGKRMAVMRRAWLDETKPGRTEEGEEGREGVDGDAEDMVMSGALPEEESAVHSRPDADAPDYDELDALLAEQNSTTKPNKTTAPKARSSAPFDMDESDDELDTMMAEHDQPSRPTAPQANKRKGPFDEDSDDDDLDALLAENDQTSKPMQPPPAKRKGPFEADDEDLDELDALLDEEQNAKAGSESSTRPQINGGGNTSSHQPEIDFTDEEAAMAEMDDMW